MVSILFAFGALLVLIPIVYFLPLGFSKKGKLIIVGISFLLAMVGIIAQDNLHLWQTVLILFILALLATYLIEKKLSTVMFDTNQEEVKENVGLDEMASALIFSEQPVENSESDEIEEKHTYIYTEIQPEDIEILSSEQIPFNDEDLSYLEGSHEGAEALYNQENNHVNDDDLSDDDYVKLLEDYNLNSIDYELQDDTLPERFEEEVRENGRIIIENEEDNLDLDDDSSVEETHEDDPISKPTEESQLDEVVLEDIGLDEIMTNEEYEYLGDLIIEEEVQSEDILSNNIEETQERTEHNETIALIEHETRNVEEIFLEDDIFEEEEEQIDESDDFVELESNEILSPELSDIAVEMKNEDAEIVSSLDNNREETEQSVNVPEESEQIQEVSIEVQNEIKSMEEHSTLEGNLSEHNYSSLIEKEDTNKLQQQIIHTMLTQLEVYKKTTTKQRYEQLVMSHLNPNLAGQDYFTFAYLLIEHYITERNYGALHELLVDLQEKVTDFPILLQQIEFLLQHYCKK
ncbi:hypothetical protein ACLM5H_03000 [Fredinandcohnia humi]